MAGVTAVLVQGYLPPVLLLRVVVVLVGTMERGALEWPLLQTSLVQRRQLILVLVHQAQRTVLLTAVVVVVGLVFMVLVQTGLPLVSLQALQSVVVVMGQAALPGQQPQQAAMVVGRGH